MDLSEQSFHRFIDLVYEAAENPRQWRRFYEALQPVLGVQSIHMLATDKRHGTLSYSDGANMPVEGELAYMQHYRFMDPRLPLLLTKPAGQWTHCHSEIPEEVVATHPFYQEFLIPYDRRYMSGTKLVDTPEATLIFATLSSAAQGPLAGEALAFMERLLPHLQRACRIGLQHFVYSTQALVGQMLVNKLRQPVILMTPGGEVMHTNEAAQELLRSTRLVEVADGRLRLPRPHGAELLAQCAAMEQSIKSAQANPEGEGPPTASSFRSLLVSSEGPGAPAETLYAFFTTLAPQEMMGTFGLRPVVMLIFYHPSSAPSIDAGLLYAVFGLSPAECRIATLLAEGLSLKQIAEVQGTQHDTVRKQLRSIYQKTATNRQPELVRLLLHLPHNAVQQ
ncbi:helix-turn-helix transcriptional regulator [Ramlibacter sp.]|uniref:helix-turn-helix transcriptional regulator n=1 Tax=Ramlibacter sp. TaxID=1917967 RepID=UPI002FC754B8